MKQIVLLACALCSLNVVAQEREVRSLNHDWQFVRAGLNETVDVNTIFSSSKQIEEIDVPHDFQISQQWVAPDANERADNSDVAANVKSRLSARGFKEMGQGIYKKVFVPEMALKGKRVLLDFEGIMYVGDVYLNGEHVGGTDYGYLGFEIDVTKKLRYGEENEIVVVSSTMNPLNSRWYTGGGLYRDVNMIVTHPQLYFGRHALKISTRENKYVDIQAEIGYYLSKSKETLKVSVVIFDAEGNEVAKSDNMLEMRRDRKLYEFSLSPMTIENAKLWSCETPHLYTVEVTLYDAEGKACDKVTERFGMRTIEFNSKEGFKLNGEKVLLKGIANHHTLGALGAAAYPRAIEKRIAMLKEWGFNHIRTSHNPYSDDMLDICDEYGILVVNELYDKWTTQNSGGRVDWLTLWQKDIPEWVKRDRNHPSVVMWSLGNELQQIWDLPFRDHGITIYNMQKTLLERYDDTRKVTVAMHPRYRDMDNADLPHPLARETDIASYNYRYMYFPGDGERYPNMIFYQSEANTTGLPGNFFEMDRDKVVGLAYWGFIDYLGESHGWPRKGWCDGVFDISLEPKPNAYLVRSMFKPEEPIVHIGIIDSKADNKEWNGIVFSNDGMSDHWNRVEGTKCSMNIFTNAEEVELFVNGKSLGVKKNPAEPKSRNKIHWKDVEYHKGYIEAVARNNGKVVARHKIETTGKATKLKVTADDIEWKVDGKDLQHVRVVAVDSKGRRVNIASDEIRFEVEGDAEIIAVTNGDNTSEELNCQTHRRLWNGSCMAIIRSGLKGGPVKLKVMSDNYKTQTIELRK